MDQKNIFSDFKSRPIGLWYYYFMSNIHYVEDSLTITPKEVLDIANKVMNKKTRIEIDCWYYDDNDTSLVSVSLNGKEPQMVAIEWIGITYGQMAYFQCVCGSRVLKLYKPSRDTEFRCRGCHNLRYRVSSFSNSIQGRAIYHMDRINKIIDTRANISHVFFKKEFTSRYTSFLVKCRKFGLHEVVDNSLKLKEIINQGF